MGNGCTQLRCADRGWRGEAWARHACQCGQAEEEKPGLRLGRCRVNRLGRFCVDKPPLSGGAHNVEDAWHMGECAAP